MHEKFISFSPSAFRTDSKFYYALARYNFEFLIAIYNSNVLFLLKALRRQKSGFFNSSLLTTLRIRHFMLLNLLVFF
jgi:hypothetical protein